MFAEDFLCEESIKNEDEDDQWLATKDEERIYEWRMKNVNDTGRRTEQEEDKAVLGRLKFLVLNLEMFVCCQR